jgi:hypothetical protein
MERAMESSDTGISDGSDTEHTGAYTACKRSSKNGYDRSDNGYDKDKGIICHRFFHKSQIGTVFYKKHAAKGSNRCNFSLCVIDWCAIMLWATACEDLTLSPQGGEAKGKRYWKIQRRGESTHNGLLADEGTKMVWSGYDKGGDINTCEH